MKRYIARLKIVIGLLLPFALCAGKFSPKLTSQDQPWSFTVSAGAVNYQAPAHDRNSALGRFALGNELLLAGNIALGVELGLQTGNRICLNIPKEVSDNLELVPIQTTLSPTLDLLITTKSDPLGNSDFFAQLKGGIAYRHWKINRIPVNEISQLAGEIQAGFGYPLTALASLSLMYQGIYGNAQTYQISAYNNKESLANIPTLHALLVGLSVNL